MQLGFVGMYRTQEEESNEEEEEEERLGLLVWEWKVALLSLLEKIGRKHFFFFLNTALNLNFWFRNVDVNRR